MTASVTLVALWAVPLTDLRSHLWASSLGTRPRTLKAITAQDSGPSPAARACGFGSRIDG